MQPALALGQTVHEVIESLSQLPVSERFKTPLLNIYDQAWKKVTGQLGGFRNLQEEETIRARGTKMLERIITHPGPLLQKAVKIRQELPYYWLSEEENIILCGKIDWLEYDEGTDGVKILDFKTGKYDEDPDSLQLPIYHLLAVHCQQRQVIGVSYWYLDRDTEPIEGKLPDLEESHKRVMEIARHIALARKLERFVCRKKDGCAVCKPLENIINGTAVYVGVNDFGQDIYVSSHNAN
jgi:ATP-dependent helicase/DNAse subunit B